MTLRGLILLKMVTDYVNKWSLSSGKRLGLIRIFSRVITSIVALRVDKNVKFQGGRGGGHCHLCIVL